MDKQRKKIDYSAEMNKHDSPAVRLLFAGLGTLFVLLGISIVFFVPWPELQAALTLFGLLLAINMYRIPSRDRPRG